MDTSMQMSQQLWGVGIIGLIVGLIIGYIIFKSSATKGKVAAQELEKLKKESAEQKAQVEEHFAESAELMNQLAKDYQKLYRHLASSSAILAPQLEDKVFTQQGLLVEDNSEEANEIVEELSAAEDAVRPDTQTESKGAEESSEVKENDNVDSSKNEESKLDNSENVEDTQQPKDYSKGSSGLLK